MLSQRQDPSLPNLPKPFFQLRFYFSFHLFSTAQPMPARPLSGEAGHRSIHIVICYKYPRVGKDCSPTHRSCQEPYSTQTLQSCLPQGMLSIFHFSAQRLMPRIRSTISRPLSVRVYSALTGNAVASTFRVRIPSSSSSFSRSERTFGVIPSRESRSSENRRVFPSPL